LDGYLGGVVTYGERLRELRAERRLSLRQVEERGGPNKDTMSLIERDVHRPHPQTLGRIAGALEMSVSELRAELEGAGRPLGQAWQQLEVPELPGLKATRERAGVSLNELAARSGVSAEEIAALEAGGRPAVPGVTERLADALGVWRAELFFPPEQVQAAKDEDARSNQQIMKELSELSAATVRVLRTDAERRTAERMKAAYDKNDEQRARERPEAG